MPSRAHAHPSLGLGLALAGGLISMGLSTYYWLQLLAEPLIGWWLFPGILLAEWTLLSVVTPVAALALQRGAHPGAWTSVLWGSIGGLTVVILAALGFANWLIALTIALLTLAFLLANRRLGINPIVGLAVAAGTAAGNAYLLMALARL